MYKKALAGAIVAVALAPLAATPAAAAGGAAAAETVTVVKASTEFVLEGRNVQFTCPTNQVMTSRGHHGDENGLTRYACSRVLVNGQEVQVSMGGWDQGKKESASTFVAPENQVVVGRWHEGDENGTTRYRTAALYWQGKQMRIISPMWSQLYDENDHDWYAWAEGDNKVMTGRAHRGDENGATNYHYSTVVLGS
ncbi:hypothetical protein [Streptosporangium sp. NPDC049644]|uniref:hypothetical protein n=1 Tax=Streptosporangium sp. NPDC049644 TaxID=3155507 RepID=UPI00343797FF